MEMGNALRKSAERDNRIARMLDMLVQELQNPKFIDNIDELIKFFSMFHRYSLMNQVLIRIQYPDAELVAGFRKWESLGRHVKRGEHGIAIFAPVKEGVHSDIYSVLYKTDKGVETDDSLIAKVYSNMSEIRRNKVLDELRNKGMEKYGDMYYGITKINEYDFYSVVAFRVVYVFDIKQTEICKKGSKCYKEKPFTMEDLPTLKYSVSDLEDEQLFDVMYKVANKIVSKVYVEEFPPEWKTTAWKGYYSHLDDSIHINSALKSLDRAETLIHECSHALIHKKYNWKFDESMEEVIVETVAYTVIRLTTGISDDVAKNYIALWLRNARATPEILIKYISHVSPIINDILDLIESVAGNH